MTTISSNRLESTELFLSKFHKGIESLIKCIHDACTIEALRDLYDQITELELQLRDATSYLPLHDQKISREKIAEIRRLIGTRQAEIKPRKKFSFTSKTKLNKNPCIGRENVSEKNSSGTLLDTMAESTNCISNKRNEYCKLDSNYLKQNHLDCLITNCQYSVIDLRDKSLVLSSVNIEKCVNCVLILGSISGSLHIAGVENSVIIGKIQQFRMHCSKSCICAIQSDSNPIIEDCSKIGFCELCHFEWLDHSNGQQKQQSLGQMIKDFNWLQDTQSPNWYILGTQDIDLLSEILCNPLKSGTCDKTLFDRLINSVISSR